VIPDVSASRERNKEKYLIVEHVDVAVTDLAAREVHKIDASWSSA
jgi:hypothetical protein